MPRYLHQVSYSSEAIQAMVKRPHDRKRAAEKLFKAAGGKMIDMYFCFGDSDVIVISEFPGHVDAAAVSMAVGATGSFSNVKTTPLISMKEAVDAMKKAGALTGSYKPPAG